MYIEVKCLKCGNETDFEILYVDCSHLSEKWWPVDYIRCNKCRELAEWRIVPPK